jgi:anti-sigma B factor antagonist
LNASPESGYNGTLTTSDGGGKGTKLVINDEAVWELTVTRDGGTAALKATGDLDLDTAPRLLAEVKRVLTEGAGTLVVDLAELTFVDSSGLGVLVACWRRAEAAGVDFRLTNPTEDVSMTLEITGLDQILPIVRV